jgi:MarR family transcriptional regulator, 2-MHQ and catechol-resistance regulon repressor
MVPTMPTDLLDEESEELITSYGVALEAITALGRAFDRSLREAAELPTTWFEALLRLHRHGTAMPVGQLGDQLSFTSGGATRLVDRLELEGLVARQACPSDRRVQWVALTGEGEAALEHALAVHLADLKDLFGDVTTRDERDALVRILGRLRPSDGC